LIGIIVNGKEWEVHPQATIADLLSKLKISPKVCVVEKNGEIIERKRYNEETVKPGDRIEIIRMMGGG
jgi:sulfur carrier protein